MRRVIYITGKAPDEEILAATIQVADLGRTAVALTGLARRWKECEAILFVGGTVGVDLAGARRHNVPVFEDFDKLKTWIQHMDWVAEKGRPPTVEELEEFKKHMGGDK